MNIEIWKIFANNYRVFLYIKQLQKIQTEKAWNGLN